MIKVIDYVPATGEILRVITYWDAGEAAVLYPEALLVAPETEVSDVLHVIRDGSVILKSE